MAGYSAAGFWSYTHDDNEADDGRIQTLAQKLRAEFGLLSGAELELFLDRESLRWGDAWRQRIDRALAGTTFFIPILTPRYFESQECRRELLKFVAEARRLGLEQLLLPVYWITVRELEESSPEDEAMALVAERHWEDLREVRLLDESSAEYRQAVNRLATRLAEVTEELSSTVRPDLPPEEVGTSESAVGQREEESLAAEEPGLLERVAEGEKAAPRWTETIEELGREIEALQPIVEESASEMEARAARAGARGSLAVAQRMARRLEEPSERIAELGRRYAAELVKIDPAILSLLALAEANPDEAPEARDFFVSLREMAEESDAAAMSLREMVQGLDQAATLSRSLRPPLRRIRGALQGVLDGQAVIEKWRHRADEVEETSRREEDKDGSDRFREDLGLDTLEGVRSRSNLPEDEAMKLAVKEVHAVRDERAARAQ